jgi:hypothetical protein
MQPEQAIQRAILELLRWRGIFCWKNNNSGIYVKARNTYIPSHAVGVSDILGVLPDGRILCVEVKTATGRLSEPQKLFLDSINERGGLAFVARSIEDVEKALHDYIGRNGKGSVGRTGELQRAA